MIDELQAETLRLNVFYFLSYINGIPSAINIVCLNVSNNCLRNINYYFSKLMSVTLANK